MAIDFIGLLRTEGGGLGGWWLGGKEKPGTGERRRGAGESRDGQGRRAPSALVLYTCSPLLPLLLLEIVHQEQARFLPPPPIRVS